MINLSFSKSYRFNSHQDKSKSVDFSEEIITIVLRKKGHLLSCLVKNYLLHFVFRVEMVAREDTPFTTTSKLRL